MGAPQCHMLHLKLSAYCMAYYTAYIPVGYFHVKVERFLSFKMDTRITLCSSNTVKVWGFSGHAFQIQKRQPCGSLQQSPPQSPGNRQQA